MFREQIQVFVLMFNKVTNMRWLVPAFVCHLEYFFSKKKYLNKNQFKKTFEKKILHEFLISPTTY